MNEFVKYIGIPWEKGAKGPHAFNCGTFAQYIQKVHFNRVLTSGIVDEDQLLAVHRTFKNYLEIALESGWSEVEHPTHGDLVMLAHALNPSHIGVWIDVDGGGVLHCCRRIGVIFSTQTELRMSGWGNLTYWTK